VGRVCSVLEGNKCIQKFCHNVIVMGKNYFRDQNVDLKLQLNRIVGN
jgi:hypothetical protein